MMHFSKHQYFIATHSNHLLDLTIEVEDISIYMVRKEIVEGHDEDAPTKFQIEAASTHDERLLEALGSRVSSIFLTNCTVWVEGITDRRYLGHFLELYVKHMRNADKKFFAPRQDFHFSFVEYSGGNITHWSFLERTDNPIQVTRLCGRLMLIADKDGEEWKNERQEELKASLGENFVCLECREIENLLTPEVLTDVLVDSGEDRDSIIKMTQEEYESASLGNYLNTKIDASKRARKGKSDYSYAEKSGTVKGKLKFCERAINSMKSYEELSEKAKELTQKVYHFIRDHNK